MIMLMSPKAVARDLYTSYDEQKPLTRKELDSVVCALKTTGIPSALQRIDADSARHVLKILENTTR